MLFACDAVAADPTYDVATLTWENDTFAGEDAGYTNGVAFTWAHVGFERFDDDNLPGWINALSRNLCISTAPGRDRAVSYQIAQMMQTPEEIEIPTLIEDDLPYAGLLAWSVNLHAFDRRVADKLSLTLGVVGPISGAEATQKWVHDVVDADKPEGWDHQIENEPVFQISAERLWRLAHSESESGVGFDVIGIGRGGVGTLASRAGVGLSLRFGRELERSFPTASAMPGREVNPLAGSVRGGWSIFVNQFVEYVANDIGVDGNTFENSHSVPLEHWQAQSVAGFAFGIGRWGFLLSAVDGSDRFEGQDVNTRFGSLSVTYQY
jgi:hypothetical protein